MSNQKLTVGELVYKISGDMDNLKTELKKAEAKIGSLEKSMEKSNTGMKKFEGTTGTLASRFKLLNAAVVGFITGALVKGIGSLLKTGSELASLEESFDRLSAGIELNGQDILSNLQKLSAGTISNKDLILSANRAIVLGVAKDMDEFSTLMQVARIRATDMGISTTQAFNDIVTGIGRSSPLILDNLGIVIKQTEAQEKYAKSLGKTADQLTVNEQREAIKYAVLENGKKQIEEVGEVTLSYADRIAQATTAVSNFRDNLGKALLPAMASVLETMGLTTIATADNEGGWNKVSKAIFKGTNFIVAIAKAFGLVIKAVTAFADLSFQFWFKVFPKMVKNGIGMVTNFKENFKTLGEGLVKLFKGDFDGALEAFKARVKEQFSDTSDAMDNFKNLATGWNEELGKSFDSVGESALNAFDDSRFEEATKGVKVGVQAMKDLADETVDSTEDTAKAMEDLQTKLLGVLDNFKKVKDDLNGDLTEAFKKFNEEVGKSLDDTNDKLAATVLDAQDKIKDLKDQLSNIDSNDSNAGEQRSAIRAQIKEQEEILKSRKGFEERQAVFVTEIREKLVAAGIDAEKEGLSSLLNIKSLEDKIKDERALRDLDEFARQEELQRRTLVLLVDGLIAQVTALREKITKQEELEAELTNFLISQNAIRKADVEDFANAAIQKYGEMARSLRTAISLQNQLNSLRSGGKPQFAVGGYVGAKGGEVHPGEYVIPANMVQSLGGLVSQLEDVRRGGGGSVDNSRTVNAPITMNNNVEGMADFNAFSKSLAWELKNL